MECRNCKKEIAQKSDRRKREFCNDTCKSAYWRKANKQKPEVKKDLSEKKKDLAERKVFPKEEKSQTFIDMEKEFQEILNSKK